MDQAEQDRRFNSCIHRSEAEVVKTERLCCGRTKELRGFWCNKKERFLNEPICWNCELYQAKDESPK